MVLDLSLNINKIVLSTMLSVSCRDVGVDCDFKGTGETEEELMNNLVDHAIKDHGYSREYGMKPEMQEKIKAQIKKLSKMNKFATFFSLVDSNPFYMYELIIDRSRAYYLHAFRI